MIRYSLFFFFDKIIENAMRQEILSLLFIVYSNNKRYIRINKIPIQTNINVQFTLRKLILNENCNRK